MLAVYTLPTHCRLLEETSTSKDSDSQIGAYQLAATNGHYVVLDTRSGKVVEVKNFVASPNASLAGYANSTVDVHVSGSLEISGGIMTYQ